MELANRIGSASNKIRFVMLLSISVFLLCCSFLIVKLALNHLKTGAPLVLLNKSDVSTKKSLAKENELLRLQFEFMVFEKEKKQTQMDLVELIKKQIELSPFDVNLWRQLTFWQLSLGPSQTAIQAEEWQFTFLTAMRLLQWNRYERPFLLGQCVRFIADSMVNVSRQCKQLFMLELKRESAKKLIHKLNISTETWSEIVKYYSLKVEHASE